MQFLKILITVFLTAFAILLPKTAFSETPHLTKVIPLPVYSTLPNEGNTFGFMPVFLVVDRAERTKSIFAPSISWNNSIQWTGTFRWYHYPDNDSTFTLIPSVSTRVNRRLTVEWAKSDLQTGSWSTEANFHYRRSLFERFFGIGAKTRSGAETSYTRGGGDISLRRGYNILGTVNVGLKLSAERDLVERIGVSGLPISPDLFPQTPGFHGSTTAIQGLSFRYDDRPEHQYSTRGFSIDLFSGVGEDLRTGKTFLKNEAEVKILVPETKSVNGAARIFWAYTGGDSSLSLFKMNPLGGDKKLRGFTDTRFYDKGAWAVELEERIDILTTRIYGVTADWRIDPFLSVGQVYRSVSQMIEDVQVAGGLGFRAFVHPNVLGRIDVAQGGEGLKVYVELGYPF